MGNKTHNSLTTKYYFSSLPSEFLSTDEVALDFRFRPFVGGGVFDFGGGAGLRSGSVEIGLYKFT